MKTEAINSTAPGRLEFRCFTGSCPIGFQYPGIIIAKMIQLTPEFNLIHLSLFSLKDSRSEKDNVSVWVWKKITSANF